MNDSTHVNLFDNRSAIAGVTCVNMRRGGVLSNLKSIYYIFGALPIRAVCFFANC